MRVTFDDTQSFDAGLTAEEFTGVFAESNAPPIDVVFAQNDTFGVAFGSSPDLSVDLSGMHSTGDYTGSYEITPTNHDQILPTDGKILTRNIVVKAIPNNYGRIGWNGAVLTVT